MKPTPVIVETKEGRFVVTPDGDGIKIYYSTNTMRIRVGVTADSANVLYIFPVDR